MPEAPCITDPLGGGCASSTDPAEGLAYLIAADVMLFVHCLFVAFVVLGLVAILAGKPLGWHFVRGFKLRLVHLAAIFVVTLQSWLGVICPLTTWEMALRRMAGVATYEGAFVAHWLQALLYIDAEPWVFTAAYSLFGLLVVISWFWVKPER